MYKFLLILLFAFLSANESIMYLTTEGWEQSDKLKDVLKEVKPEMDEFNNNMTEEEDPMFFIENEDDRFSYILNPIQT